MAQLRQLSQGKLEAYKIDPREVRIKPDFNYRDTSSEAATKHIAWLKESIRERGVDEAIWVENDGDTFWLVDGECRLRALCELWDEGLEVYVPTISFKGDESAVLAKSLIANGGLPPTLLEFGRAAERLQAFGWSVDRIAALTPPHLGLQGGKAKRYVKEAVELQQAPIAVKKAVSEGTLSPAFGLGIAKKARLNAPEVVEREVAKAKAAGKKQAKRPKGAGPVTKAKAAEKAKVLSLEEIGDKMADLVGAVTADRELLEVARSWNRARGRV